jgi:hypothetical protein
VQELARFRVMFRVGAHLRSDLANFSVFFRGGDDLRPFPKIEAKRLFEVNVFPGFHRPNRGQDVPMVASRDQNGVDVRVVEDGAHVDGVFRFREVLLRGGQTVAVGIANGDDFGVGDLREERRQEEAATAATDEPQTELRSRTVGENGRRCERRRKGSGNGGEAERARGKEIASSNEGHIKFSARRRQTNVGILNDLKEKTAIRLYAARFKSASEKKGKISARRKKRVPTPASLDSTSATRRAEKRSLNVKRAS